MSLPATITGNVIDIAGVGAVVPVRFQPMTAKEIVDGSFVYRSNKTATPDAQGDFSQPLIFGFYNMQIGVDVFRIQVPDTNLTYDAADLIVGAVNSPASIPFFGLPTTFGNIRITESGIQILIDGLYYTLTGSSTGGNHLEIPDVGEA